MKCCLLQFFCQPCVSHLSGDLLETSQGQSLYGVDVSLAIHMIMDIVWDALLGVCLGDFFEMASLFSSNFCTFISVLGHCSDSSSGQPPRGLQFTLGTNTTKAMVDTIVMANLVRKYKKGKIHCFSSDIYGLSLEMWLLIHVILNVWIPSQIF